MDSWSSECKLSGCIFFYFTCLIWMVASVFVNLQSANKCCSVCFSVTLAWISSIDFVSSMPLLTVPPWIYQILVVMRISLQFAFMRVLPFFFTRQIKGYERSAQSSRFLTPFKRNMHFSSKKHNVSSTKYFQVSSSWLILITLNTSKVLYVALGFVTNSLGSILQEWNTGAQVF